MMTLKKIRPILTFISLVLITYFLFKYYNWPGKRSLFLIVIIIYVIVYLFKSILLFFKRRRDYALLSLLSFFLFLSIALKLTYYYYNVFIAIILLYIGIYVYLKFRNKLKDNNLGMPKELYTLIGLICINSILITLPQETLMLHLFLDNSRSWGPLNWSDFQGGGISNNPDSLEVAATTASSLYYISNRAYNYPPAVIFSYLDRNRSQKRNANEDNQLLLVHEQGHFDISELYSRKAQEATKKYWGKPAKYIDSIIDIYDNQINKEQFFYDSITKHGTDIVEQQIWTAKIKESLK